MGRSDLGPNILANLQCVSQIKYRESVPELWRAKVRTVIHLHHTTRVLLNKEGWHLK